MDRTVRSSSCVCGQVRFEARGAPIFSGVCYCEDCQAGGAQIEALPGAPAVREPDGGTPYLTSRDDHFACVAGADLLVGHKLKPDAPTQRFVASCCNSGVYLKFGPGHWVSAYRGRFGGDVPPIEARSKLKYRRADTPVPTGAPNYDGFPPRLLWRLLTSRMAMIAGR